MRQEIEFKYDVVASLGMGMFGEVSKVVRRADGKEFALKMLKQNMIQKSPRILHMLNHECSGLARKYHPHVVTLHDSFVIQSDNFMIYELCEPESLKTRLRSGGAWPDEQIIELARAMLLGLDYLHGLGIIHRDIKPDNILVRDGLLKLADFGLCYRGGEHYDNDLIGSPAYLAPEVFKSRFYSEKSDVYALGISLFEMCTGKFPFENRSEAALIKKKSEFIPSRELLVSQSDFVVKLLKKMCHPKFDQRSSVPELMQILQIDNSHLADAIKAGTQEFDIVKPSQSMQSYQEPLYYQQPATAEQPLQSDLFSCEQPVQIQMYSQQPEVENQKTFYSNTTQDNVISFARSKEDRQAKTGSLLLKNNSASAHDLLAPHYPQENQLIEQQCSSQHNNLFSENNFTRVMRQDSFCTLDTTKAWNPAHGTADRPCGDEVISQIELNTYNAYGAGYQAASNRTIGSMRSGNRTTGQRHQLYRTLTQQEPMQSTHTLTTEGNENGMLRGTFDDHKSTRTIGIRGSATTRAQDRAHSTEFTARGLNFGQGVQGGFSRMIGTALIQPQPLAVRRDHNNLVPNNLMSKAGRPPVFPIKTASYASVFKPSSDSIKPTYTQYAGPHGSRPRAQSSLYNTQQDIINSIGQSYDTGVRLETPVISPMQSRNILPLDYNGQTFGMAMLNSQTAQAEAQQILDEIAVMNDKMRMPARQRTMRGGNLL